jgi:hypothetical protein
MLITKYFYLISNDPLSCFPQGGKALYDAPSPLGEGWEGGNNMHLIIVLFMLPDTHIFLFFSLITR